jgi:hypothetical protein
LRPAVELVGNEQAAFVEQFPHGSQVSGSDRLLGANFFLAVFGSSKFGRSIRTIHAHVLTGQRPMASQCFVDAIRLTSKVGIVRDRDDAGMVSRSPVQTGVVAAWFHAIHVIHVIGGIRVIRMIRISNVRFMSRGVCGRRDTFCRFA